MMKAIQITEFGGPEKMALVDLDIPTPGADEVLLDVLSIGINYADTHQVENSYLVPQNLPLVPGIEVVGRTPDGTRVVALVSSGGYAQKVTANKLGMIKVPEGVSVGDMLQGFGPMGPINVKVVEVNEETVTLDANHPLAGKKLIFDLEVVSIE